MRLSKKSKIELVVSTDTTRQFLCNLYLDTGAKVLVATDGVRMVKHPILLDDGDVSAFVSAEAIKAARKLAPKNGDLEVRVGVDTLTLTNGITMPTPKAGQPFPHYERVIPNYSTRTTVTVGLDAKLLLELCQAMGGDKDDMVVRLTFPLMENDEVMLDAIAVANGRSGVVGVLMPSRPAK